LLGEHQPTKYGDVDKQVVGEREREREEREWI